MRHTNENGNVLFYILIAVALMGGLTFIMTRDRGETASGSSASRISADIRSQFEMIRSAISECVLVYDVQDSPDPLLRKPNYPKTLLDGTPMATATPYPVKDLACRIANTGVATNDYQRIFSGAQNRFLPNPPPQFTDGWQYAIDTSTPIMGVKVGLLQTMNCSANQGLSSALKILEREFNTDEVEMSCNGTTAKFLINIVDGTP